MTNSRLLQIERASFTFFHSVFKRLVLQIRKNQGLFGKGLRVELPLYKTTTFRHFPNSKNLQTTILNQMKNGRKFSKRVEN